MLNQIKGMLIHGIVLATLVLPLTDKAYCGFDDLPYDVKRIIFGMLKQKDRVRVRRVNKEWKRLIDQSTEHLDLSACSIGRTLDDIQMITLLQGVWIAYPKVISLDLSDQNKITAASVKFLAFRFPHLRRLILHRNGLDAAAAFHISKLTNLQILKIGGNKLRTAGAAHIAKLSNLHTLRIPLNFLGAEGAAHISKLSDLHTLDISGNDIGSAGAEHIAQLSNLHTLEIGHNELEAGDARKLAVLKKLKQAPFFCSELKQAYLEQKALLDAREAQENRKRALDNEEDSHLSKKSRPGSD